jgi:hypothetical protein
LESGFEPETAVTWAEPAQSAVPTFQNWWVASVVLSPTAGSSGGLSSLDTKALLFV